MPKKIYCHINNCTVSLEVKRSRFTGQRGQWSELSHRHFDTIAGNVWPWRFMRAGECVRVSYDFANYKQMQNSINGYSRHAKGAKFRYRSEADCLAVWCVSTKEEKVKK